MFTHRYIVFSLWLTVGAILAYLTSWPAVDNQQNPSSMMAVPSVAQDTIQAEKNEPAMQEDIRKPRALLTPSANSFTPQFAQAEANPTATNPSVAETPPLAEPFAAMDAPYIPPEQRKPGHIGAPPPRSMMTLSPQDAY